MSRIILLDAGPLGLVTNPRGADEAAACSLWLEGLIDRGAWVAVPEIADYEVRRELLRAGKLPGVAELDGLCETIIYLPITTDVMRRAAELWAAARARGKPTADRAALDCDAILAAQAELAGDPGDEVIVATTNVGHLGLFADARPWREIV
ncbi:MAG: nucleic acid-binding protein [Armatimonadetes bacterium]|nr:nucleic acid-binding protein [Armatimonadota bacterium]